MVRIDIENLTCGYGDTTVLSDVNLSFSSEDGLICIIGPNGVGKSTLVRCMDNLIAPTEGRILLDGEDIREVDRKHLADCIGFVQTMSSAQTAMTVFEAVSMGRYNRLRWRMGKEDMWMIDKAISVMGLDDLKGKYISELSAGQFQKVMIARGLAQDTEVLILDEPTSNLDIHAQVFVTSLLKEMARTQNRLILMICHDVNIASKMADKVLILASPGKVLDYGTPEDVINQENIKEAYGVECDITSHEGRPNILIKTDSV